MYLYILTCISTRKNGNRQRESALAFSFLVYKIKLGMHDSFLSFQVLFLFSRQDIQVGIYPHRSSPEKSFFFFLYYVFGRIASIWLARFPFVFGW